MSGTKRRAHGIDLLRLLASVQMISGHAIDALVMPSVRQGDGWAWYTRARGLTAVAFLFASGVAFAMVAARAPERRGPRIRRALMLIGISYALHPPVALFSADDAERAASIASFFAVDVLACIGVTLLTLELVARLPARWFPWVSGALGMIAIAAAPLTAPIDATGIGAPILDYLTKSGGSLFPLLPFSGFALLGAAIGVGARPREPGRRPLVVLAACALVLGALAVAFDVLTATPPPDVYYAWPAASFARIAIVCALALVLTLGTLRIRALPTWMTILAGETLFLYVSHLLVLFVAGIGLVRLFGNSLTLAQAIGVAVVLIVGCAAGALAWNARRERRALTRR